MADLTAPSAVIHTGATIGDGVQIGHQTVVYDNVVIGNGTVIGDFCVIGQPVKGLENSLTIGAHSTVRSHSVLYQGAQLGPKLETGHFVLIRAGVETGLNLRIGSYSSLEGSMQIGDYVRMQGNVQIGPGSRIDDFAWIFSLVTATNDPLPPSHVLRPVHVGAGAVVSLGATLMPGVKVGKGAFIAAGARAAGDIPAGVFVTADGEVSGPVTHLLDMESGTRHPWTRHFADALPDEAQNRIAELGTEITAAAHEWRAKRTQ